MKNIKLFFAFLVFFFGVSVVNASNGVVTFGESDSMIDVSVGEKFAIELESNHTTGYGWKFAKPIDYNILQFIGNKYDVPENAMIGAGGKEVWTFKPLKEGDTMIVLKYVRPWEKDMYPLETKTFIVRVRGGGTKDEIIKEDIY